MSSKAPYTYILQPFHLHPEPYRAKLTFEQCTEACIILDVSLPALLYLIFIYLTKHGILKIDLQPGAFSSFFVKTCFFNKNDYLQPGAYLIYL